MTRNERLARVRVSIADGTYPLDSRAAEDAVVTGLLRDVRAAATGDALPADPGPLVPQRDPQPDDAVPEYLALIGALCSLVAVVLLAWAFDLVAWLARLIWGA